MWNSRLEELEHELGYRYTLECESRAATYAQVVDHWQHDAPFRAWFNALLVESPFKAFRWETPAVTTVTLDRPFEFVLLNCPGLARTPEPEAFAEHFSANDEVVTFANLGRDAVLIVPCPVIGHTAYGHLGAFVRGAPESQCDALWRLVGEALQRRVDTAPVWLSTAGAGVSWLHVRLDDRPKYYGYEPYRHGS